MVQNSFFCHDASSVVHGSTNEIVRSLGLPTSTQWIQNTVWLYNCEVGASIHRVAISSFSSMQCGEGAETMSDTTAITSISCTLYHVPLATVLSDARHGQHTHFELVIVKIQSRDNVEGIGYTYTGGKGGSSIKAMIDDDLASLLLGQDSTCIAQLWDKMQWHVHYVARGGIASFAISALDIALWDIRCKRAQMPLWRLAGGFQQRVRCYGGGIDLHLTESELCANVMKYIENGHTAVKIKLGKPTMAEDVSRVRAVRRAIGDEHTLMVDANMGYSVAEAIRAAKEFSKSNVLWFEEPTIPDDLAGTRRVGVEGGIAVAGGENLHTIHEFAHAINYGRLDYPQPDPSNIGGITGWLKVATLCEAHNLPVCSHGMQELTVSLLAAVANAGWMEVHSFPIDQYTKAGPVQAVNGFAHAPDVFGTGVEFVPCMSLLGVLLEFQAMHFLTLLMDAGAREANFISSVSK
eukprot:m.403233 g.403233  ORF g.403233 m.403233 type:complete len:464 (+) comp21191_c1_seq30:106-1497(+)